MTNLVFNVAKGALRHYVTLPAVDDALLLIPMSAFELDATLVTRNTMSEVLAANNVEQPQMGRKELSNPSTSQDDVLNTASATADNGTFNGATGDPVLGWIIAYKPDVGITGDLEVIPLVRIDGPVTPIGVNINFQFAESGFWTGS